jgi:hypothetical protein
MAGWASSRASSSDPTRRTAKRHGVSYSFLFMKASGQQLADIASHRLGVIHPVADRAFPFESTKEALAYVVVEMR